MTRRWLYIPAIILAQWAALWAVLPAGGQANPQHPTGDDHVYPGACCGFNDCNPIPDTAVRETEAGVEILATGEVIPHNDPRILTTPHEWRRQGWHWCRHIRDGIDGETICLYRPDRGV